MLNENIRAFEIKNMISQLPTYDIYLKEIRLEWRYI